MTDCLLSLTGLVADNGATDNWSTIMDQLSTLSSAGGGTAIVPSATSYYGVTEDVVVPECVTLKGDATWADKNPGSAVPTAGSMLGSVIGPANGASFSQGVVVLGGNTAIVDGLCVLGNGDGNTGAPNAASALFVNGLGCRVRHSFIWGGTTCALDTAGSSLAQDLTILDTTIINNLNPSGTPDTQGLTLRVNSPDIKLIGVRALNGTTVINAADCDSSGGHFSTANAAGGFCVIVNSAQGATFAGGTIDAGSSLLVGGHVKRLLGTVLLSGVRFLNGSGLGLGSGAWPSLVDADPTHTGGFFVSGCHVPHVSLPGSSALIDMTISGSNPNTIVDGLTIDNSAIASQGEVQVNGCVLNGTKIISVPSTAGLAVGDLITSLTSGAGIVTGTTVAAVGVGTVTASHAVGSGTYNLLFQPTPTKANLYKGGTPGVSRSVVYGGTLQPELP